MTSSKLVEFLIPHPTPVTPQFLPSMRSAMLDAGWSGPWNRTGFEALAVKNDLMLFYLRGPTVDIEARSYKVCSIIAQRDISFAWIKSPRNDEGMISRKSAIKS